MRNKVILEISNTHVLMTQIRDNSMSKSNNRTVHKRPDGTWGNLRNGNERDTSVHRTQQDAIDAAKDNAARQGGGDVTIQGRDGKFRDKDTVLPAKDPYPPKG
jgi:hypothetical protein